MINNNYYYITRRNTSTKHTFFFTCALDTQTRHSRVKAMTRVFDTPNKVEGVVLVFSLTGRTVVEGGREEDWRRRAVDETGGGWAGPSLPGRVKLTTTASPPVISTILTSVSDLWKLDALKQGCTTFCYCRPRYFYLCEVRPPMMRSSYIYKILPSANQHRTHSNQLRIHSITFCDITIQIATHRVDWFSCLAFVLLQYTPARPPNLIF